MSKWDIPNKTFEFLFLTLLVLEKLKHLIFEIPLIPQTLNISNLRTTSAKSVNLHTISKIIEHPLKKVFCKGNVHSYSFRNTAVRR